MFLVSFLAGVPVLAGSLAAIGLRGMIEAADLGEIDMRRRIFQVHRFESVEIEKEFADGGIVLIEQSLPFIDEVVAGRFIARRETLKVSGLSRGTVWAAKCWRAAPPICR